MGAQRKKSGAGSNLGREGMKQVFCKNVLFALLILLLATLDASAQTLDRGPTKVTHGVHDEISPGSTAFAAQFGVRFQF